MEAVDVEARAAPFPLITGYYFVIVHQFRLLNYLLAL
jgi:hypothetical protein